jgi:hypothetical protein
VTRSVDLERQPKEKTMGRPIQKRKIGRGTAKIEVTAARFSTGGVISGDIADPLYIDRQRGSLQFIVKNSSNSEKLKLVGKATPAAGQFCIAVTIDDVADGTLNDSAIYYVTKLHNRTVSCQPDDTASGMIHLTYVLSSNPGKDNDLLGDGFTIANIDVQK